MTENNIRLTYHCDVELLTPVHIGSGDRYVEHFDFSYNTQARRLTVFDRNKLLEQVAGSGETGIQAFTRAIEEETLEDWLGRKPDGIDIDAARIHNFACEKKPRDILVQLRTGTSDALLAGSSLKGAFRTAVLAKLSHEENRRSVEGLKQELMRQQRVNQKTADSRISKNLLGPDAQKNLMRCLSVGDCTFPADTIKPQTVIIYRMVTPKKMDKKHFDIVLEKISEGNKGDCQISFDTYLGTKGKDYLGGRTALTLDWILDAARRKTQKTIATELDFFNGVSGNYTQMLKTFYEHLEDKIRDIKENEVILQLAWGSGWNGMTGELLEKRDLTQDLRKKLSLADKYPSFPFPKSRRFALINGQAIPMGWVKLSFTDKEEKKRLEAEQRATAINNAKKQKTLDDAKREREKQWNAMDETEQDIAVVQQTDLALEQAPQKGPLKDVWPKLENAEPDIRKKLAQVFIGQWERTPDLWRKKECSNSQWEKVERVVEISGIDHPDIQRLDADDQQLVDKIHSLSDFGQYSNSDVDINQLSLAASECLNSKFIAWGCNNKNAKENKRQAFKNLQNALKKLRKS
ncbi:type III-A CRISPR-associated RAMP protein Csm5 [Desulfobacter sp.]|uniref:type III-A CRISPR-associated RAMP protein Csm5 n=1 Tax=Desulfobacter sp. TaxID=2294 RepID=UPI003D0EB2AB